VLNSELDPNILAPPEDNPTTTGAAAGDLLLSDDDGSEADWWASEIPYSPGDALSEWSGEEDEVNIVNSSYAQKDNIGGAADGHMASGDRFQRPLDDVGSVTDPIDAPLTPIAPSRYTCRSTERCLHREKGIGSSPWRNIHQGKKYGPTSLAVWLAAKDSGGHPARQLDPRRCFSQGELVLQVRYIFIHIL